jgi:hypothetical protein
MQRGGTESEEVRVNVLIIVQGEFVQCFQRLIILYVRDVW